MITSDYTNSLDPNVSEGISAPSNNELPSVSTLETVKQETSVVNTAVYAAYNPNDDNDAPELGAVGAPLGELWTPLILFIVFYTIRIVHKERKTAKRLQVSHCEVEK